MHHDCLRAHEIIGRLLVRDMRRRGLSLRQAAKTGPVAIGTLSLAIDVARLHDPDRRPKRGIRRGTAMVLRNLSWIGCLSATILDRMIAAMARRHTPATGQLAPGTMEGLVQRRSSKRPLSRVR